MRRLLLATTTVALATMVAGCGAAVGPQATIPHPGGLRDVRSPACDNAQLAQISSRTPTTPIRASERLGVLNTRKTAVSVDLDTLLVVTARDGDTGYLAVSTGCWVTRESHVNDGVMTVVFLMNHTGYPVLEHAALVLPGGEDGGETTYLHVVPPH
jgi:hypothetical protein